MKQVMKQVLVPVLPPATGSLHKRAPVAPGKDTLRRSDWITDMLIGTRSPNPPALLFSRCCMHKRSVTVQGQAFVTATRSPADNPKL